MFTRAQLQPYIEKGLISERKHPDNDDVCIYNYTPKCQFDKEWDDVTMKCRGLIIDWRTEEILSNPFPKFFNYGEPLAPPVPNEQPVITVKYDGSLGILYWLDGEPWIATRGSFTSDQALWATSWFRANVNWDDPVRPIDRKMCHIFEIIYKENRIVVNYDFEGLVHLASRVLSKKHTIELDKIAGVIRLRSGDDMRVTPRVANIGHDNLTALSDMEKSKDINTSNEEGFVIWFPSYAVRLKIKFEEYKRLHRIMTNFSPKAIWEVLKDGKNLDEIIKDTPDEFYDWVRRTKFDIQKKYTDIYTKSQNQFKEVIAHCGLRHDLSVLSGKEYTAEDWHFKITLGINRKDFAEFAKKKDYPGILFAMLDGKDYSQIIWKIVKPKVEQSFKVDIDV